MRTSLISIVAFAALALATPAGAQVATTMCKDGSPSATNGRGACSGHGGVDKARTRAATKAVKDEAKEVVQDAKASGAMVACGDGTMSQPGRGACSHHKGVKISQMPSSASPAMPATPAAPASRATRATPPATPAPMTRPAPATRVTPAPLPSARTASPASASSNSREDNDPSGALAQCKDGMYSHAANRRGACSRHQGVGKWMQP